jgi:hypothetical protein
MRLRAASPPSAETQAIVADHVADFVRLDLEGDHAWRPSRQRGARGFQRAAHFFKDMQTAFARLNQRGVHDLLGDAGNLDVHLQRGDATGGAGHLEVHVAEVVLVTENIRQHREAVALFDQAHRDTRDVVFQRHAGIHQRQAAAAHRRHRAGTVGFGDFRNQTDRISKLIRLG